MGTYSGVGTSLTSNWLEPKTVAFIFTGMGIIVPVFIPLSQTFPPPHPLDLFWFFQIQHMGNTGRDLILMRGRIEDLGLGPHANVVNQVQNESSV
jgi:hypothetical protein